MVGYRAVLAQEIDRETLIDTVQAHMPDWANAVPATEPWPGLGWQHVISPNLKRLQKLFPNEPDVPKAVKPETAYWLRSIPKGEADVGGTKLKGRVSFFKMLIFKKGLPVALWEDVIFSRVPPAGI